LVYDFSGVGITKSSFYSETQNLKVLQFNCLTMSEEIVKMSPKGQLVVPKDIREKGDFNPSDRFIAVQVQDGVMFKKISFDVKEEYKKLSKKVQERFEEEGLTKEEIEEAVEWARE
jgi:bifunctional DNA-binding transcriptional regulator/antitoxin component of YhaV-PrlF toxin-antitoxin module